jgi:hypothetical protein
MKGLQATIVRTRLHLGYRIGSATCQAFWYTAQRPGGLNLTRSIGSRHMATHTGLGSAGNPDEKARMANEQAHLYNLEEGRPLWGTMKI